MTLTDQKIRNYLDGPKHYLEGLSLLKEVSTKRKLLTKMYSAARPRNTRRYVHFREKMIYELQLYLKGPRKGFQSVKDFTENFHH